MTTDTPAALCVVRIVAATDFAPAYRASILEIRPDAVGPSCGRAKVGVYTLAGCLLIGSLLALTMPKRLVNR